MGDITAHADPMINALRHLDIANKTSHPDNKVAQAEIAKAYALLVLAQSIDNLRNALSVKRF